MCVSFKFEFQTQNLQELECSKRSNGWATVMKRVYDEKSKCMHKCVLFTNESEWLRAFLLFQNVPFLIWWMKFAFLIWIHFGLLFLKNRICFYISSHFSLLLFFNVPKNKLICKKIGAIEDATPWNKYCHFIGIW